MDDFTNATEYNNCVFNEFVYRSEANQGRLIILYKIITDTEIFVFELKRVKSEYRKSRCFRYSWALKPREALIAADELEWWREGKARAPLLVLGGTCVLGVL